MSNVWDRFNGIANKDEVDNAQSSFDPIEAGAYTARLEKLSAGESKSGLPMLKGMFRLLDEEGGNKCAFVNMMLQNINYPNMTAVNIKDAVSFLDKVEGVDVPFESLSGLADRIGNVTLGKVYLIDLSYSSKDVDKKFPKIRILTRYDSHDLELEYDNSEDELPF